MGASSSKKENELQQLLLRLKKKEAEIKELEKEIESKNYNLIQRELKVIEEENNIKFEHINLKEKEDNIKIEENKLKEKENNIKIEENKLKVKENKLKDKENNIKLEKDKLKEKEINITIENNKLKEKENNIILKEDLKFELEKLKQDYKNLKNRYLNLKKYPIVVGLNNIGATCYMNATLQCLSNTNELTNYFLNEYTYEPNNNKKIMSNAYYNVIKDLWKRDNNNKSISPNEFKEKLSQENPLFAGVAANDSKDLINFLIERLHNELNIIKNDDDITNNYNSINQNNIQLNEQAMLNIFKNEFKIKYNSIISNLFYGILETKSQCQICRNIKYNFQIYSFIEFPLEKVNQYCFNTGKRNNYNMKNNNNKNPDVNLYECFEYYNNIELMTGDNQMYCNICNITYDSFYGCSLYSTPDNLIINLNRGRGAVYECNVIFPDQLNVFNFVSYKNGNTVYELYAVICHIGPSSMSGHFVAYCRNRIDKKWYLYNDGLVSLCQDPNEYRKGMVYILFYQVLKSIINNFL